MKGLRAARQLCQAKGQLPEANREHEGAFVLKRASSASMGPVPSKGK